MHFQGTFQVRLSFQIDGVLTGVSQKGDDTPPRSHMESLVLQMVLRIAFHEVSSHQIRDLVCFQDSNNTPWNPPTIFHPDLIATVQQKFFL